MKCEEEQEAGEVEPKLSKKSEKKNKKKRRRSGTAPAGELCTSYWYRAVHTVRLFPLVWYMVTLMVELLLNFLSKTCMFANLLSTQYIRVPYLIKKQREIIDQNQTAYKSNQQTC